MEKANNKPPVFIVNPVAASCPCDIFEKILSKFPESQILSTQKPGDGGRLAAKAVEENLGGSIIACGGDGTFREVATEAGGKKTLGIIPLGTVNLLAFELGIPFALDGALDVVRNSSPVNIYPGRFSVDDEKSEGMFFIVLSVGPDADSVHAVGRRGKKLFGRYIYLFHFILRCFKRMDVDIKFAANGFKGECSQLMALRMPRYAGKFKISDNCSLFEPSLELIGVKGRGALLHLYLNALKNKVKPIAGVSRMTTSDDVAAVPPPHGRFQVDGDAFKGKIVRVKTSAEPISIFAP